MPVVLSITHATVAVQACALHYHMQCLLHCKLPLLNHIYFWHQCVAIDCDLSKKSQAQNKSPYAWYLVDACHNAHVLGVSHAVLLLLLQDVLLPAAINQCTQRCKHRCKGTIQALLQEIVLTSLLSSAGDTHRADIPLYLETQGGCLRSPLGPATVHPNVNIQMYVVFDLHSLSQSCVTLVDSWQQAESTVHWCHVCPVPAHPAFQKVPGNLQFRLAVIGHLPAIIQAPHARAIHVSIAGNLQACLSMLCCFCRFLDGRVWPVEDELEVRLMIALIRHVTGLSHCARSTLSLACLLPCFVPCLPACLCNLVVMLRALVPAS